MRDKPGFENPEAREQRIIRKEIPLNELRSLVEIKNRIIGYIERDSELRQPYLPLVDYSLVNSKFHQLKLNNPDKDPYLLRYEAEQFYYSDIERISKSVLAELASYLNAREVWKYKFRTDSGFKVRGRRPYAEENDSIYYVTPSGVSLRLKRTLLRIEGLKGVCQEYMEKTFFFKDYKHSRTQDNIVFYSEDTISETPQIGWHVEEECSKDFENLMNTDKVQSSFPSRVKIIQTQNEKGIAVDGKHWSHSGHPVSEIIFVNDA